VLRGAWWEDGEGGMILDMSSRNMKACGWWFGILEVQRDLFRE